MRPRAYLDTSAYLACLLAEQESTSILGRLHGHVLCSSTLLMIEAERNLLRLARERRLSAGRFQRGMEKLRQDCEIFVLRDVTIDLTLNGQFPLVRVPRSLDLVHLRTAQWFARDEEGLALFETLDEGQAAAAMEMGLPVWGKQ